MRSMHASVLVCMYTYMCACMHVSMYACIHTLHRCIYAAMRIMIAIQMITDGSGGDNDGNADNHDNDDSDKG